MNKLLGDFVPVTAHFGYRFELFWGREMYVLYRNCMVRRSYEITGHLTEDLARKECEYLEKLNFDCKCIYS